MGVSGTEKAGDILAYMEKQFERDGQHYFKSRGIAEELSEEHGYSRKEIGSALGIVDSAYQDVIEETGLEECPDSIGWGGDTSTTWYAKPLFDHDEVYERIQSQFMGSHSGPSTYR